MKSGNVCSGEFATEKAVKSGKAYLVIVAEDASAGTKKKFFDMCEFYKVKFLLYGNKEELGHSIGKEYRASVAVMDQGLAKAIIQNINQEVVNIWQK